MSSSLFFLFVFAVSLLFSACDNLTGPTLHYVKETTKTVTADPTTISGSIVFVRHIGGSGGTTEEGPTNLNAGDYLTLDTANVIDENGNTISASLLSVTWQRSEGTLNAWDSRGTGAGITITEADYGNTLMATVTAKYCTGSISRSMYVIPGGKGLEIDGTTGLYIGQKMHFYSFNNDANIGSPEAIGPGYTVGASASASDNKVAAITLSVKTTDPSATTSLTATLSGYGASAFTVSTFSPTTVSNSGSTFTVTPASGKVYGGYDALLKLSGTVNGQAVWCYIELSFTVSLSPNDPQGLFEIINGTRYRIPLVDYAALGLGDFMPVPGPGSHGEYWADGQGVAQMAFNLLNHGGFPDPSGSGTEPSVSGGTNTVKRSYQIILTQSETLATTTTGKCLTYTCYLSTLGSGDTAMEYVYLGAYPGHACTLTVPNTVSSRADVFIASSYSSLTLDGSLTIQGPGGSHKAPMVRAYGGYFTMAGNSVTLTGLTTSNNPVVFVNGRGIPGTNGYFLMEGGSITANTGSQAAVGLRASNPTNAYFLMSGGSLSNNSTGGQEYEITRYASSNYAYWAQKQDGSEQVYGTINQDTSQNQTNTPQVYVKPADFGSPDDTVQIPNADGSTTTYKCLDMFSHSNNTGGTDIHYRVAAFR